MSLIRDRCLASSMLSQQTIAWSLFTAAVITDPGVRDEVTHGPWLKAGSSNYPCALFDHYNDTASGYVIDGFAGYVAVLFGFPRPMLT